jgi:tripartite-type tricarboxylate transporter receptor subunit TctC
VTTPPAQARKSSRRLLLGLCATRSDFAAVRYHDESPTDRLNAAINKALQDPAIKRNLEGSGMLPSGGAPQNFDQRIRKDYERWTKVVKTIGLKPGQ